MDESEIGDVERCFSSYPGGTDYGYFSSGLVDELVGVAFGDVPGVGCGAESLVSAVLGCEVGFVDLVDPVLTLFDVGDSSMNHHLAA